MSKEIDIHSFIFEIWIFMTWKSGKHLIRSKPPSSSSVVRAKCLPDFPVIVIQIYNIIPLLEKLKSVCLFPCSWGYDHAEEYHESSWEDVALKLTESPVGVRM